MLKKKGVSLLFFLLFLFSVQGEEKPAEIKDDPYVHLAKFMNSVMLIRRNYADKEKTSYENLFRGALRGMMQELDPYSRYEDVQKYKSTLEDTKGSFAGVGIVVGTGGTGFPKVLSVMKGSPAEKAGIRAGDLLIEAAGRNLNRKTASDCVALIKGPAGTKVSIVCLRPGNGGKKKAELTRALIQVSSVRNVSLLSDGIGYIRISNFTQTTLRDLDQALDHLEKRGMKALILDLRNNTGGLLEAGVGTAGRFLKEGEHVLSVEGRASGVKNYRTGKCRNYPELPLVLLVNGSSASASEITAGALKDCGRAVLVGSKTFGKGSVQTLVRLTDGSALRITTARYYTPKRMQIHGKGIEPNIRVDMTVLENLALSGEMSLNQNDPPKKTFGKYTDKQLQHAEEILKGILLYRRTVNR